MTHKKISLWNAVLLNMNIMIGSGILIGPGVAAAISGNASFLAWPLVALMFLPIVLSVAELGFLFPGAGGFYLYAKEGLGRKAGYLSGWLYVVGYTFAATVEVLALRKILVTTLQSAGIGETIFIANPVLFNAVLITGFVLFSFLSMKIISAFLNSLTLVKILPLLILIALLPFIFNPSFTITSTELSLVPASLALPIFGYFGFEYCSGISHLIEDSEKNAPRAILIGFLATGLLYTLFHFGLLNLMGSQTLADLGPAGASSFADFISLPVPYLRQLLIILIPVSALITLFAGALGMINANAIILHAMAEEKLFKFSSLLLPLTSLARPWVTLVLQGVVVFLLATLLPSVELTGGLCIFGVFLSFILPFISLMRVRKNKGLRRMLPLTQWALVTVIGLSIYSAYLLEHWYYSLILLLAVAFGALIYNETETK